MNNQLEEARLAVQKAREALRNNNRSEARKWAEHAASLAPQMEDPWLVLAAIASPRASMEYIQRALKINPNSPRAHKGMEWAQTRLHDSEQGKAPGNTAPPQGAVPPAPVPQAQVSPSKNPDLAGRLPRAEFSREQFLPVQPSPSTDLGTNDKKSKRSPLYPILLFVIGVFVCAIVAWSATTSPVLALLANSSAPTPTHPSAWAQVQIAKPTYTPSSQFSQTANEPAATPTPAPLDLVNNLPADLPIDTPTEVAPVPTDVPTDAPTAAPTELAASLPEDNSTPTPEPTYTGSLLMEYVADTPTSEIPTSAPAPTTAPGQPQTNYVSTGGERWIDVNLSQQMVYAYEGNTVVNSFLVSTGTWEYPTVTGQYHIYVKYRYTDMAGPGYYLPNVPYTMYFYNGYGLHGTYWHHNFGTPMSHGCVNLSIPDSEWMFNWASVGTLVNVHY